MSAGIQRIQFPVPHHISINVLVFRTLTALVFIHSFALTQVDDHVEREVIGHIHTGILSRKFWFPSSSITPAYYYQIVCGHNLQWPTKETTRPLVRHGNISITLKSLVTIHILDSLQPWDLYCIHNRYYWVAGSYHLIGPCPCWYKMRLFIFCRQGQ